MDKSLDEVINIRERFMAAHINERARYSYIKAGILKMKDMRCISGMDKPGTKEKYDSEEHAFLEKDIENHQHSHDHHNIEVHFRGEIIHPYVPESELEDYCFCVFYDKKMTTKLFDIPSEYEGVKVYLKGASIVNK